MCWTNDTTDFSVGQIKDVVGGTVQVQWADMKYELHISYALHYNYTKEHLCLYARNEYEELYELLG